ncbi:MAG: oligopeptidase B, partial [Flavobacterium sp.]
MAENIQAPIAKIIPKQLVKHKDTRIDNYFWLNDRENPEVITYLNQENEYYTTKTAHTKEFQTELFEEMKARIKEDDQSVPYFYNGYYYITRYEKGQDYPIYARKKGSLSAAEEILFNCNELAKDHSYFQLGGLSISPNNKYASFGVDTKGRRIYTIQIKNLETGEIFSDKIENVTGGSVWANDNATIYYTHQDKVTLRSDKIYRHKLGADAKEDVLVFHEEDDTFNVYVSKEKSRKYIVIGSGSTLTSEYRILNADQPEGDFKIFQPRVRGLEYSISHYGDSFYILTNKDKATNFKLMKTPETTTLKKHWKDVIEHREEVLLEGIEIFKNYLVVEERSNGLNHIRIMPWSGNGDYYLPFDNETYNAYTTTNIDFDTDILRYSYQSMATPSSVIDFNMTTKTKEVLKEQEVLGGKFDKNNYTEERVWATATDGTKVPISMVYH